MKKKLLIAAAIAFAVFAIPCGSNALSTISVASENNTVASGNNTVTDPTPAPTTPDKPADEVKNAVAAIDVTQIKSDAAAEEAKQTLKAIGAVDLKSAMNSDASIIDKIKAIEAAYQDVLSRHGIRGYDKTQIANDSNADVKAVAIVGGSFVDAHTQLGMSTPAAKPAVTASNYVVNGDPVYVDITFKAGNRGIESAEEKHSFDIPLAITVEVPAGIDGSKAVVFHFAASGLEAITPVYNSADNTLTFAVNELSTFAIAEAEVKDTDNGNSGSGSDNNSGNTSDTAAGTTGTVVTRIAAFEQYRADLAEQIANAKDGSTIKISRDKNVNALPNDIMQALYKKQTVALELEYTYNDKEYTVTIPAGKAENNAIEWYGPLYLQMRYGK